MEAKVWEPGESSGGAQNLFGTFKGDFLEEGAFAMDLKVYTGVCQLKEDICTPRSFIQQAFLKASHKPGSLLAHAGDQM